MRSTALAAAALALLSSGCVLTYAKNRARDLFDPIAADVAGGFGLGVHAKASFVHTGLGYGQMYHWGLLGNPSGVHNALLLRPEFHMDWIIRTREGTVQGWPNALYDDPIYLTWARDAHQDPHACWLIHLPGFPGAEPPMRWWQLADVSVGAEVAFVGARVGASPGELLDFALGWIGLDIAGDDEKNEKTPER